MQEVDTYFKELDKPVYFTSVDENLTTRVSELLLETIQLNQGIQNVDPDSHSKEDLDSISSSLILEMFLQDLERN